MLLFLIECGATAREYTNHKRRSKIRCQAPMSPRGPWGHRRLTPNFPRACYSRFEAESENTSQRSRTAFDPGSAAHTQLMSAAASPGRTWNIRVVERRLPVLAGTPAAGFLCPGHGVARLSDLGSIPSS